MYFFSSPFYFEKSYNLVLFHTCTKEEVNELLILNDRQALNKNFVTES